MTRHLRTRNIDPDDSNDHDHDQGITDDNGVVHTTARSMRKINYAQVENELDYLDELEQDGEPSTTENGGEAENNDDDDDDNVAPRKRITVKVKHLPEEEEEEVQQPAHNLRNRRKHHVDEEDDSSFHEEDAVEAEEDDDDDDLEFDNSYGRKNKNTHRYNNVERQRDRNFVVPDDPDRDADDNETDDDEDDSYGYYSRSRSSRNANRNKRRRTTRTRTPPARSLRSLRSSSRRTRQNNGDADNNEVSDHATLADEIRELEEDSPIREKRSLRERTKPVNYAIPPPLTATTAEEYVRQQQSINSNAGFHPSPSRRGRGNANSGPARRLFPTGGPFGGNDVVTVFGENANFYGVNNFSTLTRTDNPNNNKLILDSDSSDDEILPLGAEPKPKKSDAKKKKKKPEIADLDPLGVDMNINFDDVGGLDNYIDQLKEMVALPLLYPELYQNFNISPPRGVLFHGPPGTGKTLMARALAASCSTDTRKITFFMRKGADILSKWVGEAERQLRLLFEEAKKQQPSIIFFDEIDGLAPVRSSKQEQIHASIVSTMLALMDGMDNRGQVIVIGATNRPDAVDPALRRPGRFDREFYFPLPDEKARAKILSIHTKKWSPPLSEEFITNLARLTKGYGGADLRALCTEAALFSIQRKFPQIYRSEEKLQVDKSQLKVSTNDFMLALQKVVPSSARSTGSVPEPLPEIIKPLLQEQFQEVQSLLSSILPKSTSHLQRDTSLIQHYIDYQDMEDEDQGMSGSLTTAFGKHELLNQISQSRICKPRLLITGPTGNGQQYIGAAILNSLEEFNVQKLDIASLLSESSRSIESAIVQGFVEARKRQPSVIYIPNLDIWARTVPATAILTLSSLLRSLQSNDRILLLGIAETLTKEDLMEEPLSQLSFYNNVFNIEKPSKKQRRKFFQRVSSIIAMKPSEFTLEKKRKKPLPKLPLAGRETIPSNLDEEGNLLSPEDVLRRKLKTFQYSDMKLKNVIKIKLSGLMDLFKNRYRKFRKPPIEDALLVHLFEPQPIDVNWQPAYVKDNGMILEVATGRRYHNMDLDIVEERLWNGYYSEPKQFLKDIELIYLDANTTGDRERIIKASEMFANAQMGIEDLSQPDFLKACKELRKRDLEREALAIKDAAAQNEINTGMENETNLETTLTEATTLSTINEVGTGAGDQLQAQVQIEPPTEVNPPVKPAFSVVSGNILSNVSIPSQEAIEAGNRNNSSPVDTTDATSNINSGQDTFVATGAVVAPFEDTSSTNKDITNTESTDETLTIPRYSNKDTDITSAENKVETIPEDTDAKVEQEGEAEKSDEEEKESEVSESEAEEEIILEQSDIDNVLKSLETMTKSATVSSLEEIYSHIMNIIWEDRLKWDKTETVKKLTDFTGA